MARASLRALALEVQAISKTLIGHHAAPGDHAPEIRRRVCEQAGWLGIDLDGAANTADAARITMAGSGTCAWVIPTNEDLMIARHTWRLTEANGK